MCYSEPLITPSATEPLCYSSVTACDTAWRYSSDTARYSECDVTPELCPPPSGGVRGETLPGPVFFGTVFLNTALGCRHRPEERR